MVDNQYAALVHPVAYPTVGASHATFAVFEFDIHDSGGSVRAGIGATAGYSGLPRSDRCHRCLPYNKARHWGVSPCCCSTGLEWNLDCLRAWRAGSHPTERELWHGESPKIWRGSEARLRMDCFDLSLSWIWCAAI